MRVLEVWYMLMVEDMERAVRFYRDVLGLGVQHQSAQWTRLTVPGGTITLQKKDIRLETSTGLHFRVENIHDACQRVEESGGRIVNYIRRASSGWVVEADLADTEGNIFTFYELPD